MRLSGPVTALALVVAAAGCASAAAPQEASPSPLMPAAPATVPGTTATPELWNGPYPVTSVVDGDTLKVRRDGSVVTVRLIGMDTPETKDPRKPVQCFGPEASAKAKELLAGKSVELQYDDTQGRTDKYGRTLAYLRLPPVDAVFQIYNEVMIGQGYAHEYTYRKPYHYQAEFRQAEANARQAQLGLWSPSTCNGDTTKGEPK